MKLEVGKKYKNRRGEITRIICFHPHDHYPYLDENIRTYTENGLYDAEEHVLDLIEEAIEEEGEGIKLEKGKRYLTRNGGIIFEIYAEKDCGCEFRFIGTPSHTFKENGQFAYAPGHDMDLVAEITQEIEDKMREKELQRLRYQLIEAHKKF